MQKWYDMAAFIIVGTVVVLNAFIVFQYIHGYEIPVWLHFIQLVLSATIIPTIYMYFSSQMGIRRDSRTTTQMWALLFLLLVPNGTILLDGVPAAGETFTLYGDEMDHLRLHFVYGGHVIIARTTADIVMVIQALICSTRIVHLGRSMHKYNLKFQARAKFMLVWGTVACLYILIVSLCNISTLRLPIVSWFYYIMFATLATGIFVLLALGYDLYPIITAEGEEQVEVDKFIKLTHDMAERFRIIMEEEKLYQQPGFTMDDIVQRLATNHTYFTRMMNIEFGMTFSQYLAKERISLAQKLLINSKLNIAEVANQCGFADASSFGRFYKDNVGSTPGTWRKEHQPTLSET